VLEVVLSLVEKSAWGRGCVFCIAVLYKSVSVREKKGLEARRIPDIESLVDAVDRVHYILILLLHSCSTPHITAGQH
jgi:hypothetical protein